MRKILIIVSVLVLLLLPSVAEASVKEKLNISHVCNALATGQTEYHFVALGLDFDPGASTVEFFGTKDGVPFGPLNASWTKTVGNVAHYSLYLDWAPDSAPVEVAITAATLTLPGLSLALANPQTFTVAACEVPTAVTISNLSASSAGGCRLGYIVSRDKMRGSSWWVYGVAIRRSGLTMASGLSLIKYPLGMYAFACNNKIMLP